MVRNQQENEGGREAGGKENICMLLSIFSRFEVLGWGEGKEGPVFSEKTWESESGNLSISKCQNPMALSQTRCFALCFQNGSQFEHCQFITQRSALKSQAVRNSVFLSLESFGKRFPQGIFTRNKEGEF